MPLYSYAWAVNWNVALESLPNVETELFPYTRLRIIAPRSQPVDELPIRTLLMSGRERGDGMISHEWELTLPVAALEYLIEVKFSLTSVASTKATIYTRRHERADYQRYNCYVVRPSRRKGTLEYVRQGVFRTTWEFTDLTAL